MQKRSFKEADKSLKILLKYKNVVAYTTEILMQEGLKCEKGIQEISGITIYPSDYFAPINVISGRLHITRNTRTIHKYSGTWVTKGKKSIKDHFKHILPEWFFFLNNRIKRRFSKY